MTQPLPSPEALLVALILAPQTFSRNKFFEMFQQEDRAYARRRSQIVRSIIKELTEPWPHLGEIPPHPAPKITEQRESEAGLHLSYEVDEFDYKRSVLLTPLEAAALRYALNRAGFGELEPGDRELVEKHLAGLAPELS